MLYVAVAVGLAALIGIHELVVWGARRTIRRPWAVLVGPVVGYLLLAGCAFALYSTYGSADGQRTSAPVTAALEFPIHATRDLVDQIRSMIEGDDKIDVSGPTRMVAVLSDADRPAAQRALGVLLRLGFFVWLALFIFDLVRLWRLSRPADVRSNVR